MGMEAVSGSESWRFAGDGPVIGTGDDQGGSGDNGGAVAGDGPGAQGLGLALDEVGVDDRAREPVCRAGGRVDETRFADVLTGRDDVTHAFLGTYSEEAFQEMAGQLTVANVLQLYRDYLENFVINNTGNLSAK